MSDKDCKCTLDHSTYQKFIECDCNYGSAYEIWNLLQDKINLLEERTRWLDCLEQAGVDNWEGITEAYKIKEGYDG